MYRRVGSPGGSDGKESACNAKDTRDKSLILGSGRSPGGGNGNPLQYFCLGNPMGRGASPMYTGDMGSVPGSGRSLGGGNGNPLQYSCLENPMDRGTWRAVARGGHKESDMTERQSTFTS